MTYVLRLADELYDAADGHFGRWDLTKKVASLVERVIEDAANAAEGCPTRDVTGKPCSSCQLASARIRMLLASSPPAPPERPGGR